MSDCRHKEKGKGKEGKPEGNRVYGVYTIQNWGLWMTDTLVFVLLWQIFCKPEIIPRHIFSNDFF